MLYPIVNHGFQFQTVFLGKTDFWLDVVEWMVDQGYTKIIVLNSEEEIENHNQKRLNRLTDISNIVLNFASTSILDTIENAQKYLKDLSNDASVLSVFCIKMVSKQLSPTKKNVYRC